MRSWWIQPGAAGARAGSVVELREVPTPAPATGELLLRIHAAGLNRGELLGVRAAKPAGAEAAGEVIGIGAGVTDFAVGDRVMGRCPGAFASHGLIQACEAMHVPAALSWEQAGAIPLTYLVAYDVLVEQGRLRAGEWLLIAGVSAGVGVACLQIGKLLGAKVIGSARAPDKLARLEALGLDVAVCTGDGTIDATLDQAALQASDGRGVDLAVDAVGGSVFAACVRALAYQGRLAMVGSVDGVGEATLDLRALHGKRLTLFGVSNKLRTAEERAQTVRGFVADLLPAFADGRLAPLIDRVYPFAELAEAKAQMEANAALGKIVLRTS